jgi:hypothetical protein
MGQETSAGPGVRPGEGAQDDVDDNGGLTGGVTGADACCSGK